MGTGGQGAVGAVRYGVIGTGMMGCEHLLNLAAIEGAEVVAMADPHPVSREWAAACAPGATGYERFEDLLARDDLDAVVVATPNMHHIEVLEPLLATDLHVMVEKPLCTTVEDSLRVVSLADARSAVTWVALEYRFMPTVSRLLAALDDVGRRHMVSIREHRFPFLNKVGDWNRFNANTGGTLVEKCCHFLDLMHLVAGARPTRVMASGGQAVNHLEERYDGRMPDILDHAFVLVDFANGVRGALDLCMFAEGGRFEQELVVVGDRAKLETTVPGACVWLGPRHEPGQVELEAPQDPAVAYEGFHHGASFIEHLRFLECVRTGKPAEVTVWDGLWSVAMGVAAHRSIDEGRVVHLAELGDLPEPPT